MKTLLRWLWVPMLLAACHLAAAQAAAAVSASTRPVRIVVPDLGDEHLDNMARIVAGQLGASSRKFVIENRPGDYFHFGAEVVARAQPDGYTLLFAPVTHYAVAVSQYAELYYDLLADFSPVTLIANAPHVLVAHPSLRAKSVADIVAIAKARPGQLSWGSHGANSLSRLEMEMFRNLSGIRIDTTPVDSSRVGLRELLAGNTAVLFDSMITVLPHVKSDRLHVLAVSGSKRSPALPQLPTVSEAGVPGFEADQWYGILAPEGVDPAVVKSLHDDFARAVNAGGVKKRLLSLGIETRGDAPADFAKIMRSDVARWAQVIKRAGVTPK